MPTVQMPDGALVDMPDQLDPALGARLRAFHDEATAVKPPSRVSATQETLAGPPEAILSSVANLPGAAVNAASDIVHRIGGNDHAPPLVPSVPMGAAGRQLLGDAKQLGADAIPAAVPAALHSADRALETASPTLHDIVGQTAGVAGDVANLLPAAGAAGAVAKGADAINAARVAAATPVAVGDSAAARAAVGYRNLPSQGAGGTASELGESISGSGQLAGHQSLTNQAVTDTLAKHEAGIDHALPLTHENIIAARVAGPAKVYDAAKSALPNSLAQDDQLRGALTNVGDTTSQLPKSPDVDALKQAMLAQPNMTRQELFANIAQAREKATAFYKSDLPDSHAMGAAYQGIANAYEDFAGRQLSNVPNSPVSLADFQAARTAFAKSYAVDAATKGTSLQGTKFAAIQQKDKDLLTGASKLIADQHNEFPLSTSFGPTTLPDTGVGAAGTVAGAAARHVTGPLIGGGIGALFGGPAGAAIGSGTGLLASAGFQNIIRRALAGSPEAGAAQASKALGGSKLADFLNPPEAPPAAPPPLELQPPPGQAFSPHQPDLATGADTQRDFFGHGIGGMTAGGEGPLPRPGIDPDAFRGAVSTASVARPGASGGDISLADLLSHGVEGQHPAAGLSLAPDGPAPHAGLPFSLDPDTIGNGPLRSGRQLAQPPNAPTHIMGEDGPIETGVGGPTGQAPGGLSLMDDLMGRISPAQRAALSKPGAMSDAELQRITRNVVAQPGDYETGKDIVERRATPRTDSDTPLADLLMGRGGDLSSIMHQGHAGGIEGDLMNLLKQTPGVPEDIMTRTANNASGESSASLEAINRTRREQASGQDRFLIDPDGKMWPVRGVEAADATAPKGSIIVQKGVGNTPYTILDRGGMPHGNANGLLNRALAGGTGLSLADLLGG